MLIPIGFFGAGGAAGSYELISSTILTSTAATVTLSSIPSTYKHLQIRMTTRDTGATNVIVEDGMIFNADSANNYSLHRLRGNGSTVVSSASTPSGTMLPTMTPSNGATTGAFGVAVIDILDYANTNKYKTIKSLAGVNTSSSQINLFSGSWRSTSAVSSITFYPYNAYSIGSRFSLYGIKG